MTIRRATQKALKRGWLIARERTPCSEDPLRRVFIAFRADSGYAYWTQASVAETCAKRKLGAEDLLARNWRVVKPERVEQPSRADHI